MSSWVQPWARADGARRAAEAFTGAFGRPPAGVWSAPGRVNIIGEHTDYNGGLCLPLALPHRAYVAMSAMPDGEIALVSAQESQGWHGRLAAVAPGTVPGWAAYAAGVAWALRQPPPAGPGREVGGFRAAVTSCVPYGAGLSSSASLEAAFAMAMAGISDSWAPPSADSEEGRAELAAACMRAENEIAGANTGGMDQAASLRSRAGHALLLDCRDGSTRQVPFDLAREGLALLVIDTKAPHAHVDGQYAQRRATCEAAARTLGVATLREVEPARLPEALARLEDETSRRRVRHVVTEIARVEELVAALDSGRMSDLGAIMDASHASLQEDYEVSCTELDLAVSSAREAGALGARMTGGGFGGSAIALVPADAVEPVAAAVTAAFTRAALASPEMLLAPASDPAGPEQ